MKTTKSIFTSVLLIMLFSLSAAAQCENKAEHSKEKVIAVINKADWCPVCQNNGKRAMQALKSNNTDGAIKFVPNDLTNEETKKKSAEKLKKLGLYEQMKSKNGTGIVFFFNAETKELMDKISVAKSNQKLAQAVQSATKE